MSENRFSRIFFLNVNSVINFRRVTHFWLCLLETQVSLMGAISVVLWLMLIWFVLACSLGVSVWVCFLGQFYFVWCSALSSWLSVFIFWACLDVSPSSPLLFVLGGFSSSLAGSSLFSPTLLLLTRCVVTPWPRLPSLVCCLMLIVGSAVLLGGVLSGAFLLSPDFGDRRGVEGELVGASLS